MELKMTGARVVKVRPMTDDERAVEGWESVPGDILVGVYDNGAILYSACSDCGGHPGEVWAMYRGQRWKIEPRAELDVECPPPVVRLPAWAVVMLSVLVVLTTICATLLIMPAK